MKYVLLLISLPAFAYNEQIHALITRGALQGTEYEEILQPPTQQDLDAFRQLFSARTGVPLRDAYDFKQFLMLNPDARVRGFDLTPEKPMTRRDLLAAASRWPDDDGRNRARLYRDEHRALQTSADGTPVPYDPATLDFGGLTGTNSQAHAHYGLTDEPLSDDTEVLKREPWRFAVPVTAHATGPDLIRIYSELAALAAHSGLPSAAWLEAVFAGAAFHHLEDLCNQIHTVQVGIYEFFEAAYLQSKVQDLKTLGGLFGRRYSLRQIGVRLVTNHHLLSEEWYAKRIREGGGMPDLTQDDPDFQPQGELARAIIARSSREGAEAYRLAWTYSAPSLHDGIHGHAYVESDDPDAWVSHTPAAQAAMNEALTLSTRGVRRAATAVRLAWHSIHTAPSPSLKEEAAWLSNYHAEAATRRAAWKPDTANPEGIAWAYPLTAAAVLATLGLLLLRTKNRLTH